MVVVKFGGAVLREPQGFRAMEQMVRSRTSEPVLVVVSAFATATRDLEFSARLACKGLLDVATERLGQVLNDHRVLVKVLLPKADTRTGMELLLDEVENELRTLLEGIATTRQLTPRTLDRVLARGEYMALHVARHVLQLAGLNVASVDAERLVVTTDEHLNAKPLRDKTAVRVQHELLPAFEDHSVVMVQGFVGRTEDGHTTTMGRESSNLTATLLGSLLDAREVVIVTDVEGIRSADPHETTGTVLRPHLSFDEATIAAENGLKLLHPTMIEPAIQAQLPIRITSVHATESNSTLIDGSDVHQACKPIVIAQRESDRVVVTCVFATIHQWLIAMQHVIDSMPELTIYTVECSEQRRTARMTVGVEESTEVVWLLHESFITTLPQS